MISFLSKYYRVFILCFDIFVRKSIKLFEAQQLNESSEMDDNNNRVKDKRNDRFAEGYHK